jgi:hypothetical protein
MAMWETEADLNIQVNMEIDADVQQKLDIFLEFTGSKCTQCKAREIVGQIDAMSNKTLNLQIQFVSRRVAYLSSGLGIISFC